MVRSSARLRKRKRADISNDINKGVMFELPSKTVSPKEDINWGEWVAASSTKNYMMDDGFLDVLSIKSSPVIKSDPNFSKEIGKMVSSNTNHTGFVPSLLSFGNKFESKVISLLTKELGSKNIKDIGGNFNPRSTLMYEETVKAIKSGVPCIFQGILRNYDNKTYGVADVLIRSDWVNKFLDVNALSENEIHIPASSLHIKRRRLNKNNKYHYVVIDIKYKSLPLRSDGIHLRNDSNMKAYKSQLWIYNEALSKIQGYLPLCAFILGSKWKYTSGGIGFEGNSCFDRLGRIDYSKLDKEYIEKTEKAVNWLNDIRSHGDEWDLSSYPLPRDELYPNMCNRHDYPYHGVKKLFAENHNDLTLLWNVGPKQRRIANTNGVYNWKDLKCTSESLGVTGEMKPKVLNRILEANHSEGRNIYPKYIDNNFDDWKNLNKRTIELFVDFETTCSVFNDLNDLTFNDNASDIFLIGAGYVDPESGEWIFKKFIANEINEDEELRICTEFISFVEDLKCYYAEDEILCFHWSHAEPSSWKRAFEKRPIRRSVKCKSEEIEWSDLMKVFLLEPIGVKGCLSYNLKTIAKTFFKHGYISTVWDSDGTCADGADAAVGAYRANIECMEQGQTLSNHIIIEDIIKYNEVDCKVLMEILYYLREHHIDPNPVELDDDDVNSEGLEQIEDEYNKIFHKNI